MAVGIAIGTWRGWAAALARTSLGAALAGAALAQWRTAMVAAPVLERRWGPDEVTGRVVAVEIRPEGRRIVLDRVTLPGLAPAATPAQVRVRLADPNVAQRPGDRIAVRAQLF